MTNCSVCGRPFNPEFAYQVAQVAGRRQYFCHLDCRRSALGGSAFRSTRTHKIAVLNQKGGTGKTTTSVNLAAGLANRGFEVLLVDTDAQGNVGASLGIRGEKTLFHVLVEGAPFSDCVVPVRQQLDVITSDRTLAAAEVWLARLPAEDAANVLAERLTGAERQYQYIVLDCGPSLNLLNQNALTFTDEVLIPVSCDYLALLGVKEVLKTLKEFDRVAHRTVRLAGVLPTLYDARTRLAREAIETLRAHFKDRCLDPIRINTRLGEAPSRRLTIYEYAPDSHGAEDYNRLVDRVVAASAAAQLQARPSGQRMAAEGAVLSP